MCHMLVSCLLVGHHMHVVCLHTFLQFLEETTFTFMHLESYLEVCHLHEV